MRCIFLSIVFFLSLFSLKASDCNKLYLCENGLEMLEINLSLIRQAESRVELAACIFGGDICQRVLSECEKRMQKAKELHVHISAAPILMEVEDRAKVEELQRAFPDRFHFLYTHDIPYTMPTIATIHAHAKFMVVDGRYFSFGGTNLEEALCSDGSFTPPKKPRGGIARANIQAGARDQDVVGFGPLADDLREIFYTTWAMWNEEHEGRAFNVDPLHVKEKVRIPPIAEDKKCRVKSFESNPLVKEMPNLKLIFSGPMHKPNRISEEYVKLINEAKEEIVLANLYFNPVESIFDALKSAVNRGRKIELITNGAGSHAPRSCGYFAWAHRISFFPLFQGKEYSFWEAGKAAYDPCGKVRIFEYGVENVLYHKKVMVVDRHIIVLGSYNLGIKSDAWDYETVIVIDSKEMASDLLTILEKDRKLSFEVSPAQARSWYFDPATSFLGKHQRQLHTLL